MSIPAPIIKVRPRVTATELQYYWSPPASGWMAAGNGSSGCIGKSTDGMTWTIGGNPFIGGPASGVAWNGTYWIAVGYNQGQTVCIAKSSDGIEWTPSTNNPFPDGFGNGIAWNGTYWIAVGTGNLSTIAKSTDGMTWTSSDNPFSGGSAKGIAWNGSYWVAIGQNGGGTVCIAKSTNGITWTQATNNPFEDGYSIAWNGSYWLAGGYISDYSVSIARSTDGLIWTNSDNTLDGVKGISWNGSYWIAVGNSASVDTIIKSTDGISWTVSDSPFTSANGVAWNGSYWIAVGVHDDTLVNIAKSTDGITWNPSSNSPFTTYGNAYGIAYANIPVTSIILESASPSISYTLGPTEGTKTVTGLTTGTNYSFTVKTDISGAYSDPVSFRTVRTSDKPQPVSSLDKVETIVNSELNMTFTWTNPNDYAYFYIIGLKATVGSQDTIYSGTSDYATLSYSFTGLDPTRSYTFHIQRGNDAGYSSQTSIIRAATPVFDPITVSNLRLWLDATDVSGNGSIVADGTTITRWYDKSGTANNGTASVGATLETDDIGRYINFQGLTWYNLATSSWAYNQYYTIFIVDKPLDYVTNYTLLGHQSASSDSIYIQYADGIRLSSQGDNAGLGATFEDLSNNVNIWCFTNYGGKTAYWNRLVSGKNPVISYITDSTLSIGAKEAGSDPYSGRMREVLIYTGIMAEADRENITTYLYNKWFTQPILIPLIPVENGAVLWLDAADIKTLFKDNQGLVPVTKNSDVIRRWNDKSGFENHMFSQGSVYQDISGLPSFYNFTTTNIYTFNPVQQTGDISLFLIGWSNSITDYFFLHDSSGNFGLRYNGSGISWCESSTNNNQFPYKTGKYMFYGTMRKGQLIAGTYINNKIYKSYAIDTLLLPVATESIFLSATAYTAYYEIIYYNRVLSDSEIQENVEYLSNKWAIPIPSIPFAPAGEGLQVWLDGSDPCTVLENSGVITWKDKSLNNNDAVSHGSPTFDNGFIFDGSGQYFSLPDNALPTGDYSYYTLVNVKDDSAIIKGGDKDISGQMWVVGGIGTNSILFSYDGISWLASTSGNSILTDCYVVTYTNDLWLAGGDGTAQLAYSTDGINWMAVTIEASVFEGGCYTVNYGNGKWIAGGSTGGIGTYTMGYSIDGINWLGDISGSAIFTVQCLSVAYGGGKWVAGGSGTNKLGYSTDGINWTASTSGNSIFIDQCNSVAYGNGKWVAGGVGTNKIAYSTDGINWTASTSGNSIFIFTCNVVTYRNNLWMAGGNSGVGAINMAYSVDGINWTPSETIITNICTMITYGDGLWVAGGTGTDTLVYSANGINWTKSTNGNFLINQSLGGTYGPAPIHNSLININTQKLPLFVTVGFGTYSVAYSYDGITYIPSFSANAISAGQSAYAVGYGDGKWIMAGEDFIGYSSDGITWNSSTDPFGSNCFTIIYANGIWVAGGQKGVNSLVHSLNGISWTASSTGNNIFYACYAVIYAENIWIATGDLSGGTVALAKSVDGILWTEFSNLGSIITSNCSTIAYGNGLWLAGGYGTNKIAYSNDTITWYPDTSGNLIFSSNCFSIKYANGIWVACGTGNTYNLAYSTDGLNWTGVALADISYLTTVNYTSGIWFAGGYSYSFNGVYSNDGINWYPSANAGDIFTVSINSIAVTDIPTQAAETSFDNSIISPVWLASGLDASQSTIIFSRDSVNWNTSSASSIFTQDASGQCLTMAYANNMWVIGGRGLDKIAYSYNGINWTVSITATQVIGGIVYKIAYGDGRWVAVGNSDNFIVYSFNGADWMQSNDVYSLGTDICRTVAYANGIWVAGGDYNSTVIYSIDAIHWLSSTSGTSIFTQGMLTVANGNGRWIAGGNAGSGGTTMAYSTNGINWVPDISGSNIFTIRCNIIEYGNGLWVAGGRDGNGLKIIYSTDGINWNISSTGSNMFTNNINSIAYTNEIWRAGGNGTNQVAYSNNGMTWYADISANNILVTSGAAFGFGSISKNISKLTDTTRFSTTDTVIIESIYRDASGGKQLFLSGITGATDISTHIQDASNNYIGWDTNEKYMNGTIKEILVYNQAHTTEQRQAVENYLINKWYSISYSPTAISTPMRLWLDSESAANFLLNGSAVEEWKDKTPITNDFRQINAWAQPIYSLDPVINKYGVQFAANGIANGLTSSISPFGVTEFCSIFAVQRYDYSTNSVDELVNDTICTAYNTENDTGSLNLTVGTTNTATPSNDELTMIMNEYSVPATVEIHEQPVLTCQVITENIYNDYYNGVPNVSTVLESVIENTKLNIGFTGTLTPTLAGAMRGYIYEIIVFNAFLTVSERQSIEGYLAWKWGIQNSLPTAHPYSLSPP